MVTKLLLDCHSLRPPTLVASNSTPHQTQLTTLSFNQHSSLSTLVQRAPRRLLPIVVSAAMQPLDLTEENVEKVLADARVELAQLFDNSVGITGQAELAELDGPFVKIRLRGRFWHKRSTVLARLDNYLKQRIPEILEVDIEDEKQLDDSPL
uniref:Uncharacterized protein n=1 Tax=Opuntia streptacantha TaxID=393608 RepID=A0A7C9CRY3_OPUST